jgi:ribosomal protein S14
MAAIKVHLFSSNVLGADKSLARPTSQCHRTESSVVRKSGLVMCRIASLLLLQRLK